uniref:Uncharacterized protein n=1 Tax=Magallana gigas TaxID=29159 RepID=K1R372_MAGGI
MISLCRGKENIEKYALCKKKFKVTLRRKDLFKPVMYGAGSVYIWDQDFDIN